MPFGVGDHHRGARQPQCMHEEVVLVGDVHRRGHRSDSRRTEPEVHPLGACRREQSDGVSPANAHVGQHVRGGAGSIPHLLERHRSPGDGHQHAVTELLSAPVQHRWDREAFDTELRRADRPARPAGFRHSLPPGPGRRRRCTRNRPATARCRDRSDAPIAAARRSHGPPPAPSWASRGTSCSPR